MTDSVLLRKVGATPSTDVGQLDASVSKLPIDLLREASRRLGHAALAYSSIYFFAYFGTYLLNPWMPFQDFLRHLSTSFVVVSILLGLAVFLLSRYARIRPDLLLDLGLIFEVVAALGIAMANVWGVFSEPGRYAAWRELLTTRNGLPEIPWECAWILIFPLIAPNTPGKVLLASLAAASTGPLTLLLSKSVGATNQDVPVLALLAHYATTTYVCAGIAFVISRQVHKVGRRLKSAREIGSYRLTERLGAGGMGEVWVGRHRLLARPAAIKLIRPETLGGDESGVRTMLRRFEREAQATAALRSPHTVELYDFGVTEDGSFYYVMELLQGLNFKELVEHSGPVSAARAVHLLRQACSSLGEAHTRGLVHRDIKPANLFACQLGNEYDYVKVLDFGLVKTQADLEPRGTELTAKGVVTGTPDFMAPEMASGESVDGRADLYALGCVAYWLLTGCQVFEGDTPMSILLQHMQAEPVRPSVRMGGDLPEALESAVLSCLAKDPADRPPTAEDLDQRLADSGLDEDWNATQAATWWQQHMPQPGESENGGPTRSAVH